MLIAQITDPHIVADGKGGGGRVDTKPFLEAAVAQVNAFRPTPDIVLVTGDIIDDGEAASYVAARTALDRLERPWYVIPGNHDDREPFRAAFAGDHPYMPRTGFLHYTIDLGTLRLLALDTYEEALNPAGTLCDERLAWLDEALGEAADRPVVIVMHHPPVATGHTWLDTINCHGGERMAPLIEKHGGVAAILCGHVHRLMIVPFCGTTVRCAPSVAYQVPLALGDHEERGYRLEPPAFAVHLWRPQAGLITHLKPIGDFPKP